jgi:hypothetical protein
MPSPCRDPASTLPWPWEVAFMAWQGNGMVCVNPPLRLPVTPPLTRNQASLSLFTTPQISTLTHFASNRLWRWNRHSVPKRRLLKTIRRTTQKITHDRSYFLWEYDMQVTLSLR